MQAHRETDRQSMCMWMWMQLEPTHVVQLMSDVRHKNFERPLTPENMEAEDAWLPITVSSSTCSLSYRPLPPPGPVGVVDAVDAMDAEGPVGAENARSHSVDSDDDGDAREKNAQQSPFYIPFPSTGDFRPRPHSRPFDYKFCLVD